MLVIRCDSAAVAMSLNAILCWLTATIQEPESLDSDGPVNRDANQGLVKRIRLVDRAQPGTRRLMSSFFSHWGARRR